MIRSSLASQRQASATKKFNSPRCRALRLGCSDAHRVVCHIVVRFFVVERFIFLDAKTMRYEATIDDLSVYTRPWTVASRFRRRGRNEGEEYWEDACHEGERSADNMLLPVDRDRAALPTKP